MTRTRFLSVALFAGAFAGSLLLVHATSAHSAWRRQAAAGACRISTGGDVVFNGPEIQNNSTGWNYLIVACPVVDLDTVFPKSGIATLSVSATNNHSILNLNAFACVAYETAVGGACGPATAMAHGSGAAVLTIHASDTGSPLSEWSADSPDDFGYVVVELPTKDTGGASGLRGIYTST